MRDFWQYQTFPLLLHLIMTNSPSFLIEPKYAVLRKILLVVALAVLAFGATPIMLTYSREGLFIYIGLISIYVGLAFLNINYFAPRLLPQGKYFSYVGVIFGGCILLTVIGIFSEWALIEFFRVPVSNYGVFGGKIKLLFAVPTFILGNFIGLFSTSLIFFLRHWLKSGERIVELEESKVRIELEKERTKIDYGSLFSILEQAATVVVSAPAEASRILLDLSKSLRQQLYESEHKTDISEKPKNTFDEKSTFLILLLDNRFRWARNAFLVVVGMLIGASNSTNFVEFVFTTLIFLGIIYLNIYVLLPRLFFKNRLILYLLTLLIPTIVQTAAVIIFLGFEGAANEFSTILILFVISNAIAVSFIIVGTSAAVLFQNWARNERRISELETAAMRAELEQLQNQINPHFLFNTLNNILVLVGENPEEAAFILHKMNDMLKYQFYTGANKEAILSDEIQFLNDFLNLEKIRRDRFEFAITVDNNAENTLRSTPVPPALFITFVENAVKHSGDAKNLSFIRVNFAVTGDILHFTCHNSKPAKAAHLCFTKCKQKNKYGGLGLANVRRRLDLLYENDYSLNIKENETDYTVELNLKLQT